MKELKTNQFKVFYENGTVRHIKSGNTEIVRMIYSAVRDHNWGTIEPEIIEETIVENEKGFQVIIRMKYHKADIHFETEFIITGNEYRLEFEMQGEAKSIFNTNRVGFCVLHPIKDCTGKNCTVFHPDGSSENKIFPKYISPEQPMINISQLEWNPTKDMLAKLSFSGDIFEMEDQRNWTDASYKTYCRPLSLPFPYEIKKGEKIRQKIVLEIYVESKNEVIHEFVSFRIDKNNRLKLPEIGVGAASRNEPLEYSEAEILKQIPIHHLRAELKLFEKNFNRNLNRVSDESCLLGIPLFLVLYFSENFKTELTSFQKAIEIEKVAVKYILVVGKNHLSNDFILNEIYTELKELFPDVKIGSGVNAYFAELNRNQPNSEKAEFISFAVCPQVHAFDNVSLVENLEAQKYVVESTEKLFPGKPVFISPVTLKQRFNVVATSDESEANSGELPSQVDTRQNSVFAAQWLLGSLKFLSQSGAGLITYFETVDWRGFIQGNYTPLIPERFSAQKGDFFPIFHLLNEFEGFDAVVYSESNKPLELEGIVLSNLKNSFHSKILISNFNSEVKRLKPKGITKILSMHSVLSNENVKTKNDEIIIPGNSIICIEIKL